MTETEQTRTQRTPEDIRSWLVGRVAYYCELPIEEVDSDALLVDYGLDSVYAFALCGDVEDALGLRIEPTLLWDVDTLAELTAHLVGLTAG